MAARADRESESDAGSSDRAAVAAVRSAVGLFDLSADVEGAARGLIEVTGSDARRWLDGMLSNDVTGIAFGSERSGCYATLLTIKGRIIADLHVLAREGSFWLELAGAAIEDVLARLDRYIIADDVKLANRTAEFARIGLEGPRTENVLARASEAAFQAVALDSWCELQLAGAQVPAAHFGWSGERAYQLFVPIAKAGVVRDALLAAGRDEGLVRGSFAALEILRIEAGIPRLYAELDEAVFPDEARLDRAISRSKGCYTGQEIVARLYSRGAVNHLLVGLRFEGEEVPAPDTELLHDGRRCGEVTSSCLSGSAGAIGLGFLRRAQAEPGTVVMAGALRATVVPLPFVAPTAEPAR